MFKKLALSALFLVAFVFLGSVEAFAQAANIDQCRNGDALNPVQCTNNPGPNTGWVNGNAGQGNSHWQENQFISYRMLLTGLTTGATVHTVTIGYDVFHLQGQRRTHAIDYLGDYDETETDANPCSGVAHCEGQPRSDYFTFPEDPYVVNSTNPNTGMDIEQIPGGITMWGGDILSVTYDGPYTGAVDGDERRVTITFTASVPNPVLAWGGHIAWAGDWGSGNSSGAINGSPYHMRLKDLDGKGGNQDLQLSADAVEVTGAIIIIKEVVTSDGTNESEDIFEFNAASSFNPLQFFLEDDNDQNDGGADNPQDRKISNSIFVFGNAIRVTEEYLMGYRVLDIVCRDQTGAIDANSIPTLAEAPGQDSFVDVVVDKINPTTAQIVTCRFVNGKLTASAGPVNVSGQVTDKRGKAISGAVVTMEDVNTRRSWSVYTDKSGNYKFPEVVIDEYYTVIASHSRYKFDEFYFKNFAEGDLVLDFKAN